MSKFLLSTICHNLDKRLPYICQAFGNPTEHTFREATKLSVCCYENSLMFRKNF